MEIHFAVRFLIVGIALIYVMGPLLWNASARDNRDAGKEAVN
jgi:hypothetical protein